MPYKIYLSPPHLSDEGFEQEFVDEAFKTNWVAPLGPNVDGFEKELSEYIGIGHAAALTTGTAAIHLALILLGVSRDDEVICSSFTFSASINPAVYLGATPVFIDSEAESWNMDPDLLSEELERCAKSGKLPKAVIAVDLYGQSADYDRILPVCERYDIPVIEDAAEALGAEYKGVKTGGFGKIGVFSFNGNKIITTSGGGMLVSDDEAIVKKARFLSTQARDPAPHYQHSKLGFNYRMSNILAGVGRGQLKLIEKRVSKRREIFEYYRLRLGDIPGVDFMPEPEYSKSNRWLTCITVDPAKFGASCEDIRLKLEEHSIESRPLWKPMHVQPFYEGCRVCGGNVSASLFKFGLCLPSGTALKDADLDMISELLISTGKL